MEMPWHGMAWKGMAMAWKWNGMEMFEMAWKFDQWHCNGMNWKGMTMAWHGNGMASTCFWDWVWEGPLSPCVL
jgi:hypothetical protein